MSMQRSSSKGGVNALHGPHLRYDVSGSLPCVGGLWLELPARKGRFQAVWCFIVIGPSSLAESLHFSSSSSSPSHNPGICAYSSVPIAWVDVVGWSLSRKPWAECTHSFPTVSTRSSCRSDSGLLPVRPWPEDERPTSNLIRWSNPDSSDDVIRLSGTSAPCPKGALPRPAVRWRHSDLCTPSFCQSPVLSRGGLGNQQRTEYC